MCWRSDDALAVWTYEGPPHVGAMRIATGMKNMHYLLHAPQETPADLLFTMIERRVSVPVTYTTFQARDLGKDTAELFQEAVRGALERFKPEALMVGSSCTAELIQDDPAGLADAMRLECPVIPLELQVTSERKTGEPRKVFTKLFGSLRTLIFNHAPGKETCEYSWSHGARVSAQRRYC